MFGAPSRNSGLKETEMHLKYALRWALAEVLTYLPEKLNAPEIFCKTGMEWFYRLCKDKPRIGRMMELPKFARRNGNCKRKKIQTRLILGEIMGILIAIDGVDASGKQTQTELLKNVLKITN